MRLFKTDVKWVLRVNCETFFGIKANSNSVSVSFRTICRECSSYGNLQMKIKGVRGMWRDDVDFAYPATGKHSNVRLRLRVFA